jgi:hypothetical protein
VGNGKRFPDSLSLHLHPLLSVGSAGSMGGQLLDSLDDHNGRRAFESLSIEKTTFGAPRPTPWFSFLKLYGFRRGYSYLP